jgi:maltose alpha-D-glucosyltransferase/alpha-amylase
MKLNLGIRRRLMPLLDGDRRLAELFHALLFSLPGSPVMYYGDEIGMGDNVYLGDRDSVRTPMPWSPDRNAGFSTADFAQLYLPPLMDPVYGYQAVNVEAQMRNASSFLQWVRRMLHVRRQHPVFGTGRFDVIDVDNPSIFAYVRSGPERMPDERPGERTGDTVLCVHNLSRMAQPCELPLTRFAGRRPIELLGRVPFPQIGELPYLLTLPSFGFFWFDLSEVGG